MEYRYCRELKHNYLIVKNDMESEGAVNTYQMKMLERSRLKGFIPCSMRTINNESFFYYEINSMQSLNDRFSSRGMSGQQVYDLFKAMKDALCSMADYLLGIENVILDAKSVFTDLDSGEFKFMYCPFGKEPSDIASFVDELFLLVDHDDQDAVEMIYSCAERAQTKGAVVMDCIDYILGLGKENLEKAEVQAREPQDDEWNYEDEQMEEPAEDLDEEASWGNVTKKSRLREKFESKMDGKIQLVFAFMFMVLIASMMYIRMNYILTDLENQLSVGVLVVSTITGLVALLSGINDIARKGAMFETKKDTEIEELYDDEEYQTETDMYYTESTPALDESNYKKEVNITASTRFAAAGSSEASQYVSACGETVVLDCFDDEEKEITLYSRNAEKTLRIPLGKLPITLGKMQGCVDKVISDSSVSRLHCRFFRDEDGCVKVIDLGSTNGTFRNGLRLNPQQGVCVEEGDEIRIGRICFDCR